MGGRRNNAAKDDQKPPLPKKNKPKKKTKYHLQTLDGCEEKGKSEVGLLLLSLTRLVGLSASPVTTISVSTHRRRCHSVLDSGRSVVSVK